MKQLPFDTAIIYFFQTKLQGMMRTLELELSKTKAEMKGSNRDLSVLILVDTTDKIASLEKQLSHKDEQLKQQRFFKTQLNVGNINNSGVSSDNSELHKKYSAAESTIASLQTEVKDLKAESIKLKGIKFSYWFLMVRYT